MKREEMTKTKKVIFRDTEKNHENLKVKLYAEDIKISEFMRLIAQKYLENDERILEILDEYKEVKNIQSKRTRDILNKEREKAKEQEEDFGLDEEEIEEIYDMFDD